MDDMESFVYDAQGLAVLDYLYDPRRTYADRCDHPALTSAAIVMVEVSLFRLLDDKGVRPSAVVGSSLGEFAAMAALEYLEWPIVLDLVVDVARRVGDRAEPGGMLAVLGDAAAHDHDPALGGTEIVSVNHEAHYVLAGGLAALDAAEQAFDGRGVVTSRFPVGAAFHSSRIEGARTAVIAAARGAAFDRPDSILYSSTTAARVTRCTPEKCWEILRQQIRFSAAVSAVPAGPGTLHVDLTPSSSLAAIMRGSHPDREAQSIITPFHNEPKRLAALLPPAGVMSGGDVARSTKDSP